MSYYFIANIKIKNSTEYNKYLEHVDEIFTKYKWEYLAADSNPSVNEGRWVYTKSVLIKTNNKQDFNDWF
jgi:uncharacterized protein (DUF1330 family)